ncbi:hypothetical protein M2165_000296 [Variovorax sp. TBS-050B]|uniref:hypothetical protein n=1 Tax=Variovorax sp. TBS-050B TaxID=2940551 RepID=UPI0024741B95|nr:hypothetical protein [Variovorax sp. TBS-050B]MDH6590407.1 hypothetical protein [Variovorax sp. TBS-050B]
MVTLDGQHVQSGTGETVTYEMSLIHGLDSSTYAARVLLAGDVRHELEGGMVIGPDQNARTAAAKHAVLAQIDNLDFEALNRPLMPLRMKQRAARERAGAS